MRKSGSVKNDTSRRPHFNLIYFIDSARTRSLKIPLGRLTVVVSLFSILVIWSIASIIIIANMNTQTQDLQRRLEGALTTILEYEVKYDAVYEKAYPSNEKPKPAAPPTTIAKAPSATSSIVEKTSEKAIEKPVEKLLDKPAEKPANKIAAKPNDKPNDKSIEKPREQTVEKAGDKSTEGSVANKKPEKSNADSLSQIVISNTNLELHAKQLELRFDITNNSAGDLAEGYLWAVAEFKTDQGETLYIGAPQGIDVGQDGEPKFPERSSFFAIRHFKKKMLSFPFAQDKSGSFVSIKIGMKDKAGQAKTTQNVPANIRVQPKSAAEAPAGSNPAAKKPG